MYTMARSVSVSFRKWVGVVICENGRRAEERVLAGGCGRAVLFLCVMLSEHSRRHYVSTNEWFGVSVCTYLALLLITQAMAGIQEYTFSEKTSAHAAVLVVYVLALIFVVSRFQCKVRYGEEAAVQDADGHPTRCWW